MKLKQRHIFLIFSVFFAALLGNCIRKVFNEHDLSKIPFLIIDAAFMVSCYLAGYLLNDKEGGEATT